MAKNADGETFKCPKCKLDFWLKDQTRSGYCIECHQRTRKLNTVKKQKSDPVAWAKYQQDYRVRRREAGNPIVSKPTDMREPAYAPRV